MKKVHYFYKIENKINKKYYYGVHTSTNPERDNYWGSGPAIKAAIKKYGKENFSKTILRVFKTQEEAFEYEKKVVTLQEIQNPLCYNMQLGGKGGSTGAIFLQRGEDVVRVLPEMEEEYKSEGYVKYHKSHSEETLQKMSRSHRGVKRSQNSVEKSKKFISNTIWMNKDGKEVRISRENQQEFEQQGWIRGRNSGVGEKVQKTLREFNQKHPRIIKVSVNKQGEVRVVLKSELTGYLEQGWNRGTGRTGRKLSEETKRKLSEIGKARENQTRGRIWIHREYSEQKRIKPEELENWKQKGWKEGHSDSYKDKLRNRSSPKDS